MISIVLTVFVNFKAFDSLFLLSSRWYQGLFSTTRKHSPADRYDHRMIGSDNRAAGDSPLGLEAVDCRCSSPHLVIIISWVPALWSGSILSIFVLRVLVLFAAVLQSLCAFDEVVYSVPIDE